MQSHLKLCMLTISLQIFQKFRSNLPKYLAGSIKAKCKLIESLQSNATKNYTCIRTLLRKVILCSSMLCVSLLGVLYPFCWSLGAYSLHFLFIYLSFRKGGSTHDRRQQASSSGLSAEILAALLVTFRGPFTYDVRCFLLFLTYSNQILYYISLFGKIRFSLAYLPQA